MMAAVIVHFGNPEHTRKLLRSLEYNIIIVVLHSEYIDRQAHSNVLFLEEPNKGYAAGLNAAVRYLQQDHPEVDTVLAMNPDIEPDTTALQQLLDSHLAQKADATFPAIREGGLLLQGYSVGTLGTIRRVKHSAHLFPGTCFLFSIDAWIRAEGFNEEYFHYFEDLDFCETLLRLNGRIYHAANVVVQHVGKSGTNYPETKLPRYAVRNHLRFVRKFHGINVFTFLNICLRHLLYLFRWPAGWRGIREWYAGIREFRNTNA